jgi:peroxiredoxin
MMRKLAAVLALVVVAALAGVWTGQALRDRRATRAAHGEIDSDLVAGVPFPAVTVVAPDGAPRSTAELTAGGALVLFLRSDCSACGLTVDRWRREIAAGELRGVPVLGITTEPPEVITTYRQAEAIPFPVYSDPERVFLKRHGVAAVPFVVAVAPGGQIRDRLLGYREDTDLARLRRLATE